MAWKKDCGLQSLVLLITNSLQERWYQILSPKSIVVGDKLCHQSLWLLVTNIHQAKDETYSYCIVQYFRFDEGPILTSVSAETRSSAAPSPATARLRGWLCTVDHVSLPRVYDIRKIPGDGTRTHSQHILKWSLTKKNFSKIIPINETRLNELETPLNHHRIHSQ